MTGSEYVDRGTAIQLVCNATGRPDPPHNVDWYKVCHIYDVVTCKMKLFQNYSSLRRRTSEIILPEIISKSFKKIAAHEYFPTCSMSLK